MAYPKQPLRPRSYVPCGDPYEAVDWRRRYCRPSCKTLASRARRKARPPEKPASPTSPSAALAPVGTISSALAAPAAGSDNQPSTMRPSRAFDGPTIQVGTLTTILDSYSVRALDKLLAEPDPKPAQDAPREEPQRLDPASWFPAAVLSAPALSVPLHQRQGLPAPVCLPLVYFGGRFYSHPAGRCRWGEGGPGRLGRLTYEAAFTRVFPLLLPELAPPGTPTACECLP